LSSATITNVGTRDPIVAIRNMVKGDVVNVAKEPVIRIGRDPRAHVVIDHQKVSRCHGEIRRAGRVNLLRSVGKNPVRLRGRPMVVGEVEGGDWIELTEKHLLLLMNHAMVDAVPAIEFFLRDTNPSDVSRLLQTATEDRTLVLFGTARDGRDHLAREIHRISRRAREVFLLAKKKNKGSLRDEIAPATDGTAYVDLDRCGERDLASLQKMARLIPPPVRLILGASSTETVRECLATLAAGPATESPVVFRVPDLGTRPRLLLAIRALQAHGLGDAKERIGVDVLEYVVHHESVANLDQLWRAPVRLAALVETKGMISSANDLLRRWGYPQGESTLGDWVHRLEIDPKQLWGVDQRIP